MIYPRRMPFYFLVDTTHPAAKKRAEETIELLLQEFRCDPQALEVAHVSVITFSSDSRQLMPLTELMEFKLDPGLISSGPALPAGLALLRQCIESEVRKSTPTSKGDFKTLVFVFSSEELTEAGRILADPDRQASFLRVDCEFDFDPQPLVETVKGLLRFEDSGPISRAYLPLQPEKPLPLPPPPPPITDVDGEYSPVSSQTEPPVREPYLSRFMIYFLVDTSESTTSKCAAAMVDEITNAINSLKTDPLMLETAWISVITFDRVARQVTAPTELHKFQMPELRFAAGRAFGAGLRLWLDCMKREVIPWTSGRKGDYKAICFLLLAGEPTDSWEAVADEVLDDLKRNQKERKAELYPVAFGKGRQLVVVDRLSEYRSFVDCEGMVIAEILQSIIHAWQVAGSLAIVVEDDD